MAFRLPSAADRFSIYEQSDRGPWLQVIEIVVCGVIGHRAGLLSYESFVVEEAYDPETEEWYSYCRDEDGKPFLGCLRCLAEVELELPPPVPVDIVDWK